MTRITYTSEVARIFWRTSSPPRSGSPMSSRTTSKGRRTGAGQLTQGVRTRAHLGDLEPVRLQVGAQDRPDLRLVVDDEHSMRHENLLPLPRLGLRTLRASDARER